MFCVTTPLVWISVVVFLSIYNVKADEVVALNDGNIDTILNGHDIVLVNFYADWCRFSQILKPTFEEAGKKVNEDPEVSKRVVFAKVDCDKETTIAGRYRINKYPTLKMFRNGNMIKKEYRGQRSAESLFEFAQEQAKDPVKLLNNIDDLDNLDSQKMNIIGYLENKDSDNYQNLAKVASILRDDCSFHVATGDVSRQQRVAGDNLVFRPPNTKDADVTYPGDLKAFDALYTWTIEKCMPLVRAITFLNAEELTEEGLPFLILFHDSSDKEIIEIFKTEVTRQLLHDKANINFLTADGQKFAHPLHHLGKSAQDLPVLAIDSFRHMYLFPHDVRKGLAEPGKLKTFVEDLHSGKLHREFHHGPDSTEAPPEPPKIEGGDNTDNIPRSDDSKPPAPPKGTQPPESTFKKLAPSRNRYTILRDEL